MGQDRWGDLIIGYQIDIDQFKVTIPEEFHMEERFSEKTGRKLKRGTKVVDKEAEEVYRFEGIEDEDDVLDFAEKLGEKLGVSVTCHGDLSWGNPFWYISVPMSATSVEGLQKSLDRVPEFKKIIEDSGIEVGDFEVDIIASCSS